MTAASLLIRAAIFSAAVGHAFATLAGAPAAAQSPVHKSHGVAIHGDLKYPPGFKHFDYVNPNAPKGGAVRLSAPGTFDNLNPYILRGVPAIQAGVVFDTLLASAADEPNSEYGLIAESVEMPDDRSWIIFNLRPEARFHDGSALTADDVIFSFDIIRTKGHPRRRLYYQSVEKAEKLGPHQVKFIFKPGDNRELPVILGSLPVLSKAYWEKRDFERTTLEPPLGSGPYKIDSFEPGRSITYRRVPDYWAKDLPVSVGLRNFDTIRYDYYRDNNIALEAFKAGEFDLRDERVAKNWAVAYDVPAVRRGLIKRATPPGPPSPPGMQGYFFNTRRDIFEDWRVRKAISYAFDFEWSNRQLFYGSYRRTQSYFSDTELAARGLPEGDELALLAKFKDQLPERVFTEVYQAPSSDGPGGIRGNLLTALKLLEEAGWQVDDRGKLVETKSGRPLRFEILLSQPSLERLTGPFLANLKRLGIDANMRTVDTSQYQNRMDSHDFDMTVAIIPQSMSPGNEQREFFSSEGADAAGSYNYAGVRDPVVDQLVDLIIAAPDRQSLVTRSRALDRVLLAGYYVVPNYFFGGDRIAFWDKFGFPDATPLQGYQFDSWWVDAAKDRALGAAKAAAVAELKAQSTDAVGAPASEESKRGNSWAEKLMIAAGGLFVLMMSIRRWRKQQNRKK
ncbi:MAG TPA: extracellular solute-binding protein [Alphaproteobacteria bacterium]|nr:extracellular solute-binding protein [Alphaproteobacteria bacterium]